MKRRFNYKYTFKIKGVYIVNDLIFVSYSLCLR